MKQITIRELHLRTGDWIRRAGREQRIIVTERGHAVATILPFEPRHRGVSFASRKLLPEFETLKPIPGDVTGAISEDQGRA